MSANKNVKPVGAKIQLRFFAYDVPKLDFVT